MRPLTPDDIADVGRALYGERWQTPLAADIGISDRNLRYWLTGERAPQDPGHVRNLLVGLLVKKGKAALDLAARLRAA
jgi:hypothetical protein